jgi:hypothetical protein
MASTYWIKLYHEILHDPKMERLTDHQYRRCIELFLQAGESDMGGLLPPVNDMAWTFRTTEEAMLVDLVELSKVGIVNQNNGRWIVTHFADRQDPITPAEGMARLRDRRHKAEYYTDEKEEAEPEVPETITQDSQPINPPSEDVVNEPVNEPLRILTQIRLDKNRIDTDKIRTDPALPAASTPPTALNISLSNTDSDSTIPVPRTSSKPPPLPPTNPPDNANLTVPEIAHLVNRTVGFYAELLHPKIPGPDDMQAIRNMGKLWGYKHVYTAFQDSARGSSPYRTIPEIYSHLGDGGLNV